LQASKETKNPVDGVRKNDIEIGESHTDKKSEGQARKRGNIPSAPPTCIPFMNTWGTERRPTSFCTAWWIAPPSSEKTRLVSFS